MPESWEIWTGLTALGQISGVLGMDHGLAERGVCRVRPLGPWDHAGRIRSQHGSEAGIVRPGGRSYPPRSAHAIAGVWPLRGAECPGLGGMGPVAGHTKMPVTVALGGISAPED